MCKITHNFFIAHPSLTIEYYHQHHHQPFSYTTNHPLFSNCNVIVIFFFPSHTHSRKRERIWWTKVVDDLNGINLFGYTMVMTTTIMMIKKNLFIDKIHVFCLLFSPFSIFTNDSLMSEPLDWCEQFFISFKNEIE